MNEREMHRAVEEAYDAAQRAYQWFQAINRERERKDLEPIDNAQITDDKIRATFALAYCDNSEWVRKWNPPGTES